MPQLNRRNYYRILNVQPDASLDIIKANYRALMQKLKMHPDLGGDEGNASLINIAYSVLRNPNKRAEYDNMLLEKHSIQRLSNGPLRPHSRVADASKIRVNPNENRRNYYRVLHLQPDADKTIILTSYQALYDKEQSQKNKQLLREAVGVLVNKKTKQRYDKLLRRYSHQQAISELHQPSLPIKNIQSAYNKMRLLSQRSRVTEKPKPPHAVESYRSLITQYCQFCKTPHEHSPSPVEAALCIQCQSPLFPPDDNYLKQSRRSLNRQTLTRMIEVYLTWPGKAERYQLLDISPTGIKMQSHRVLHKQQIVKIDSNDFKAVGEVMYSQPEADGFHSGLRFLTVLFDKQKGQFFSVKT